MKGGSVSILNEQRSPYIVGRIRAFFPQVNRVADSSKPLKVTVKTCDVTKAKSLEANDCAMAHAIERELKCDGAIVRPTVAWIIKGDLAIKYGVPGSVAREIVSFDRNHDFREGDYQLTQVCPCRRMDAKVKRTSSLPNRKHVRTVRRPLVSHITTGIRGVKPKGGV